MSIAVALRVKETNEVVLVSDRRGTYGDPREIVGVDNDQNKIHPFANGALAIVDHIGQVLIPIEALRKLINKQENPVELLFSTLQLHYRTYYKSMDWFSPNVHKDNRPRATVLYVDPNETAHSGLYVLDSIHDFAPFVAPKPCVIIGTFNYAFYLYTTIWREDFKLAEAIRLALLMVCETAKLDPKVGGEPDVLILAPNEEPTVLSKRDVDSIIESNEQRVSAYSKSFREVRK